LKINSLFCEKTEEMDDSTEEETGETKESRNLSGCRDKRPNDQSKVTCPKCRHKFERDCGCKETLEKGEEDLPQLIRNICNSSTDSQIRKAVNPIFEVRTALK
jgi:hypothetical protein